MKGIIELENNRRIYYLYDANGTKLRKYYYEDNRLIETTDYSGMFVYKDDHIDYIQTSEGRMKWDDHDGLFYQRGLHPFGIWGFGDLGI